MKRLIFVLPSQKVASSRVRALCLSKHLNCEHAFYFVDRKYLKPLILGYVINLFRFFKYLISLDRRRSTVFIFIKPIYIFPVFVTRLFGFRDISLDINDPYHHPMILGFAKTFILFILAPKKIFESIEYYNYCSRSKLLKPFLNSTAIIEDSPQHTTKADLSRKEPIVVWFGSPTTSQCLLPYLSILRLWRQQGFTLILMGASSAVSTKIYDAGISHTLVEQYNFEELSEVLIRSQISFVPMPIGDPLFELRGNLKAKLAMSFACCVFAADLAMHRRLILSGHDGILFSTQDELSESVLSMTKMDLYHIMVQAYIKISTNYSAKSHAHMLSSFLC